MFSTSEKTKSPAVATAETTCSHIQISTQDFSRNPRVKQYVYLVAVFQNGPRLEKVVIVSFQAGYIFIETDKTLYTPGSYVLHRIFGLTPGMEAVERNSSSDTAVTVDIETPNGLFLPAHPVSLDSAVGHGQFRLPEIVSFGIWKIVAKFSNNRYHSFSAAFEVKDSGTCLVRRWMGRPTFYLVFCTTIRNIPCQVPSRKCRSPAVVGRSH